MTVKELYTVCDNLYDSTMVKMFKANGVVDRMYMRDLVIRYGNNEVVWFELLQFGTCMIEVRL